MFFLDKSFLKGKTQNETINVHQQVTMLSDVYFIFQTCTKIIQNPTPQK